MSVGDILDIINLIGLIVEIPGKMKILRDRAELLSNKINTYNSILEVITKDPDINEDVLKNYCNQFKLVIKQAKSIFEKCVHEHNLTLFIQQGNYGNSIEKLSNELDSLKNTYEFIKHINVKHFETTTVVTQTKPSELEENFKRFRNIIDKRGIRDVQPLFKALYDSGMISAKQLIQLAPDRFSMDSKDSMDSILLTKIDFPLKCAPRKSRVSMVSSFKTCFKFLVGGDSTMQRMKPFSEDELFENLKKIAHSLNLEFNEETNGTLELIKS